MLTNFIISIKCILLFFFLRLFFLIKHFVFDFIFFWLDGFFLFVVEHINKDVPLFILWEPLSENEHFPGEHPIDHWNAFGASVVAGNGDVNVGQRRIRVAEGNAGDIHVGGLYNGLMVLASVSHYQQTWLLEFLSVLICEGSWDPSGSRNVRASSVRGKLHCCPLSVDSRGNHLKSNK